MRHLSEKERSCGSAFRDCSGQASIEWVGLVLLVSAVMTGLSLASGLVPGLAVVQSLSRSLLCAASLSEGCFDEGSLEEQYGPEVAGLLRSHVPDLLFGPDLLGLPVDFRSCRSAACADAGGGGVVGESTAGEPVTLFTRVVDCREAGRSGDLDQLPAGECEGEGEGNLYLQYWAYYPESASFRGVPVIEQKGFHRHDWESTQVRVSPDGEVDQRASSHAGYNHTRSALNWGSDIGSEFLSRAAEAAGFRERGGWGPASGALLIAGGSHAGNVAGSPADRYPTRTPASMIRLIPLEGVRGGPLARPADFHPITPPWQKSVWENPEADGTG
jgi:hypothetical protein